MKKRTAHFYNEDWQGLSRRYGLTRLYLAYFFCRSMQSFSSKRVVYAERAEQLKRAIAEARAIRFKDSLLHVQE